MNDLEQDLRELFAERTAEIARDRVVPAPTLRRMKRRRLMVSLAPICLVATLAGVTLVPRLGDERERSTSLAVGSTSTTIDSVSASTLRPARPAARASFTDAWREFHGPPQFFFVDAHTGYAVLDDGSCPSDEKHRCVYLARTTDGGRTWSQVEWSVDPEEDEGSFARGPIVWLDDQTGYATGDAVFRTADGGRTWQAEPLSGRLTGAVVRGGRAWGLLTCAGSGSRCPATLVTATAGTPWAPVASQPPDLNDDAAVVVADDREIYVLLDVDEKDFPTRGLSVSADGGSTWSAVPPPETACFGADFVAEPDSVWFACREESSTTEIPGKIFRSFDRGRTWSLVADNGGWDRRPVVGNVGSIDRFVAPGGDHLVMMSGKFGSVRHSTDGGTTWTHRFSVDLGRGLFAAAETVFVLGPWVLHRSTDFGKTWETVLHAEPN